MNQERIQAMEIMLMHQHLHVSMVAEKLGITRQRVWQLCKEHNINIHRPIHRVCAYCEGDYTVGRSRARRGSEYCSDKCYHTHRRSVSDFQPNRQGQRIARKKIEDWLGEELPEGYIVHHEDGNQKNNDFSNIYVFPSHAEHLRYHHAKRRDIACLPYNTIRDLPDKLREWAA